MPSLMSGRRGLVHGGHDVRGLALEGEPGSGLVGRLHHELHRFGESLRALLGGLACGLPPRPGRR